MEQENSKKLSAGNPKTVIVLLLIAAIMAIGVFFWQREINEKLVFKAGKVSQGIYKNEEFNYSFQYPRDWQVSEESLDYVIISKRK